MSHPQTPRLITPMLAYLAIAVLAGLTLTGRMRLAVWIFLAGLAVKTWLATQSRS